jgi:hypothetical protein
VRGPLVDPIGKDARRDDSHDLRDRRIIEAGFANRRKPRVSMSARAKLNRRAGRGIG